MCPLGIQITRSIRIGRQALAAADLLPPELRGLDDEQVEKKTLFGVGAEQLHEIVRELAAKGIDIPLDKPQADVLLLTSASDLLLYRDSLAATARILDKLRVNWTLRSEAFEASNFGFLSGDEDSQQLRPSASSKLRRHVARSSSSRRNAATPIPLCASMRPISCISPCRSRSWPSRSSSAAS